MVPAANATAASYDGTVALSKAVFLDSWLIPRLSVLNRLSTWIVDEAWWEGTVVVNTYRLGGHIGWFDAKDWEIRFDEWSAKDVPSEIMTQVNGTKGRWYRYTDYNKKEDTHGLYSIWMKGKL